MAQDQFDVLPPEQQQTREPSVLLVYIKHNNQVVQYNESYDRIDSAWKGNNSVEITSFPIAKLISHDSETEDLFIDQSTQTLYTKPKPSPTSPDSKVVNALYEQNKLELLNFLENLHVVVFGIEAVSIKSDIWKLKYEEGKRYLMDVDPNLDNYPMIKSEIIATGAPATEIANLFVQQHEKYLAIIAEIETFRRYLKLQILSSSPITDEKRAIFEEIIQSFVPPTIAAQQGQQV